MQNPIAKLVPQYFGEYPKPFQKLFNSVSFGPDQKEEEVDYADQRSKEEEDISKT